MAVQSAWISADDARARRQRRVDRQAAIELVSDDPVEAARKAAWDALEEQLKSHPVERDVGTGSVIALLIAHRAGTEPLFGTPRLSKERYEAAIRALNGDLT